MAALMRVTAHQICTYAGAYARRTRALLSVPRHACYRSTGATPLLRLHFHLILDHILRRDNAVRMAKRLNGERGTTAAPASGLPSRHRMSPLTAALGR